MARWRAPWLPWDSSVPVFVALCLSAGVFQAKAGLSQDISAPCEDIFFDEGALLQRPTSRTPGATSLASHDLRDPHDLGSTSAVRGYIPQKCPNPEDCADIGSNCDGPSTAELVVREVPSSCSLCRLAPDATAILYTIQRGDGAGTRVGQALMSMAYASQYNLKFGGFFLPWDQKDLVHGADQPTALSAFLGCNYSDLLVHVEKPRFAECWSGAPLGGAVDNQANQAILLHQCNGISCRPDLSMLTWGFLAEVRKSTLLLSHPTPLFEGNRLRVAIHIRRGDRQPGGSAFSEPTWASDTLYLDFLSALDRLGVDAQVHVFSTTEERTKSKDFDIYRSRGAYVHLDGDAVEDWAHMAQADLLLIAPSTYSWAVGLLNDKCVAIFKYVPFPVMMDWISLSEDLNEFGEVGRCLQKKGLHNAAS